MIRETDRGASEHVTGDTVREISRRRLLAGAGAAGVLGGISGLIPGAGIDHSLALGAEDSIASVKDFGAKGDGTTDDSAAIQKAINETAGDGRTVFIPGGVYMIGTPLAMRDSLTLRGASRGLSTLRLKPSNSGPIIEAPKSGGTYQPVKDLVLADLTLDGDAEHTQASGAATPLVRAYQTFRWHVVRCIVKGSRGYGIGLLGDPRSTVTGQQGPHEDTYIVDCQFDSNGTVSTGYGFATNSARKITLEHCTATRNRDAGISLKAQFAALVGCHSVENGFASPSGKGFVVDSTPNSSESTADDSYVAVLGGSAEKSPGAGLAILRSSDQSSDKGMTHVTVAGFHSVSNGRGVGTSEPKAPYTDTAISLAILGGHYDLNKFQGIAVNGVRELTIQGAICRKNETDGLLIKNTVQAAVTGCQFRDNKRWGIYTEAEPVTPDWLTTVGNVIRGNAVGGFLVSGANSKSVANNVDEAATVASASTIKLPACEDTVLVTGTTSITSITASSNGRTVVLRFEQALTVVNGSNLRLASNFQATTADTLTLVCQSGIWYEVARSANA